MEFREVRSLVTLADAGTIAGAAARLHLTAPAIHRHLKSLGEELGVPLYEHSGNRLVLTAAALVLIPELRALLSQHESAIQRLDEWKGLSRGTLRIGTGPTIANQLLPSLLHRFHSAFPGTELVLETGIGPVITERLVNGLYDVVFLPMSQALNRRDLSIQAQWDFEVVVATCLPNVPRSCSILDLQDYPFVLFGRGFPIGDLIDNYLAETGVQPRIVLSSDNTELIVSMTCMGMGISMLPVWAIREHLASGRMARIRQHERRLFVKLALVVRRSAYLGGRLKGFLDLARDLDWSESEP